MRRDPSGKRRWRCPESSKDSAVPVISSVGVRTRVERPRWKHSWRQSWRASGMGWARRVGRDSRKAARIWVRGMMRREAWRRETAVFFKWAGKSAVCWWRLRPRPRRARGVWLGRAMVSTRRPASLRFWRRRSLGHLREGSIPVRARTASAVARAPRRESRGRRSAGTSRRMETQRPRGLSESQGLPWRPWPAVWISAARTAGSEVGGEDGEGRRRSWVEVAEGRMVIR